MIPLILAPLLAKLAESGLSLIGNAVLNKGKQVVEEQLGVSLDTALETDEGKQALLQLQNDHEEMLLSMAIENRKLDIQEQVIAVDNTKSARDLTARIQESAQASWAAKNFPYVLDGIIVGSTVILTVLLFFAAIPEDNLQIANIALGSLLTLCGTVVNFHRGSSATNKQKDATIENMSRRPE